MRISDWSSDVCSSDLLAQRERLQPSLLDRLRDDDPRNPKDAIGQQSQSARGLRESLLRDLGWLLNSRNLDSVQDLSAYPEVARLVVNFGLPEQVDRKSVGEGKSVSERVDMRGRRILKKKTREHD